MQKTVHVIIANNEKEKISQSIFTGTQIDCSIEEKNS